MWKLSNTLHEIMTPPTGQIKELQNTFKLIQKDFTFEKKLELFWSVCKQGKLISAGLSVLPLFVHTDSTCVKLNSILSLS